MLYAIISQDVENSLPLRIKARPAHLERLNALKQEGRLILAGPHPAIDAENRLTSLDWPFHECEALIYTVASGRCINAKYR